MITLGRFSLRTQDGLRQWAKDALEDELFFESIGGSLEHWALVWFQLRESEDRAEWFPSGKSATLQKIEYLLQPMVRESLNRNLPPPKNK